VTDHLDEIEGRAGMANMAVMTKAYYDGLRQEGFDHLDAMRLTVEWLRAIVAGGQR
jgi:hypothetical protein